MSALVDVLSDLLGSAEFVDTFANGDTTGAARLVLQRLAGTGFVVVAKSSLVTTDVLAQFNYNEAEASTALAARTALAILQRFLVLEG
jgi:hypothetical protein